MLINNMIGNRLKELRLERGYSQTDVAKGIDKTKSAISSYENGGTSFSVEVLIDYCNFYGISLSDFLKELKLSKNDL